MATILAQWGCNPGNYAFSLFLALLCGWLVDICPLAKFLMHLQVGSLGNKERQ